MDFCSILCKEEGYTSLIFLSKIQILYDKFSKLQYEKSILKRGPFLYIHAQKSLVLKLLCYVRFRPAGTIWLKFTLAREQDVYLVIDHTTF